MAWCADSAKAVSYTHLDVYKRQSLNTEYSQPDCHEDSQASVDDEYAGGAERGAHEECDPHGAEDTTQTTEGVSNTSAADTASRRERLGQVDSCGGNGVGEGADAEQEANEHDKRSVVGRQGSPYRTDDCDQNVGYDQDCLLYTSRCV